MPDRSAGSAGFPTTHWTLVRDAGQSGRAEASAAGLGQLLVRYLPPLRAHLVRRKRLSPDQADDLLQSFVADKICQRRLIAQADRARGRFRTFLLTALDRYLVSEVRRRKAGKRAADAAEMNLDESNLVLDDQRAPDIFDVTWAQQVLSETLRRMQLECSASGRDDVWGVFETRLLEPALHDCQPLAYEELVRRFAIRSPAQASNLLVTAKRTFARLLRATVGEYASDETEIQAELRDLKQILAGPRPGTMDVEPPCPP